MQGQQNVTHKVILLGDSGVGKTSFFLRITKGQYVDSTKSTLEMDIACKKFKHSDA